MSSVTPAEPPRCVVCREPFTVPWQAAEVVDFDGSVVPVCDDRQCTWTIQRACELRHEWIKDHDRIIEAGWPETSVVPGFPHWVEQARQRPVPPPWEQPDEPPSDHRYRADSPDPVTHFRSAGPKPPPGWHSARSVLMSDRSKCARYYASCAYSCTW